MNNPTKLLAALDATFGFPNKIHSTFKKTNQTYDNKKNEHIITIAYIVTVNPGQQSETVNVLQQQPGALFRAVTQ